jgi:hypothetical protein
MTGPDHYCEAERLIGYVKASENAPRACALLLAEAQIHATLALVAATAVVADDEAEWKAAVSDA